MGRGDGRPGSHRSQGEEGFKRSRRRPEGASRARAAVVAGRGDGEGRVDL